MGKIAVVFPGIGYTKDRPLLYYTGKMAVENGYQLRFIDYSEVDCDKGKLKEQSYVDFILDEYLRITEQKLIDLGDMKKDQLIFISKSLGTVVATAYARKKSLKVKHICFSPLEMIGSFINEGEGILFYGDNDPFADYRIIEQTIKEKNLDSYRIGGGNHSLETGDVITDIDNLKIIMQMVYGFKE